LIANGGCKRVIHRFKVWRERRKYGLFLDLRPRHFLQRFPNRAKAFMVNEHG
jgi:hypothetical protein